MTNQELKKEMFEELEKNGISKKQVTISAKSSMYDDIVRVTIQDIYLKKEKIESILKHHESIRWDEHAQEILQGCNIYLEVSYNNEKIELFRKENKIEEKAIEILERAKIEGLNGCGVYIIKDDPRFVYFLKDEILFIHTREGQKHFNCWQHYEIMNILTHYILNHYEPLEDYQTWEKEQEKLFKIECEKREEERKIYQIELEKQETQQKKDIKNINKYSSIVKIAPENQKTSVYKWAHLNKNSNLSTYIEEVKKHEYYERDGKVTHEWTFTDFQALQALKNNLLTDFEQLAGLGGSDSDDERLKQYDDVYKIPRDIMQSAKWYNLVVAVIYENKIQFVIDPQGFNYARYVGLQDQNLHI